MIKGCLEGYLSTRSCPECIELSEPSSHYHTWLTISFPKTDQSNVTDLQNYKPTIHPLSLNPEPQFSPIVLLAEKQREKWLSKQTLHSTLPSDLDSASQTNPSTDLVVLTQKQRLTRVSNATLDIAVIIAGNRVVFGNRVDQRTWMNKERPKTDRKVSQRRPITLATGQSCGLSSPERIVPFTNALTQMKANVAQKTTWFSNPET